VADALKSAPDSRHIAVRRVRHTLAELRSLRDTLAARFGAGADAALVPQVSEATNQVVVWQRDGAAQGFTAQRKATLDQVVAESGGAVTVRAVVQPHQLTTAGDVHQCHMLYCTGYGAMRGGLRLDIQRDNGTFGGCTSGFNVRAKGGQFAGTGFILTAGHCVASGTHTHLDFAEHQHARIFQEEPALRVNAFPQDYAFLRYIDQPTQSKWLDAQREHNLVLAWCRNGGWDTDKDIVCRDGDKHDDGRIHITSVAPLDQVRPGWVVCATGAGASSVDYTDVYDSGAGAGYRPGTRCGVVTQLNVASIDTDICARAGDSGGPLFSEVSNAGLGILEGNLPGQDRSGPCFAGEANNYVALSSILSWVNASPGAAGSTFEVITRRRG
jgi:streptogrisin C